MVMADFKEEKWEEDNLSKKLHKELFSTGGKDKKKSTPQKNKILKGKKVTKVIGVTSITSFENNEKDVVKPMKPVKKKDDEKVSSALSELTGKELAIKLAKQRKHKKRKLKQMKRNIERKAKVLEEGKGKNKSNKKQTLETDSPRPKKERNKYKAFAGKSRDEIETLKSQKKQGLVTDVANEDTEKDSSILQDSVKMNKKSRKMNLENNKTGKQSDDNKLQPQKSGAKRKQTVQSSESMKSNKKVKTEHKSVPKADSSESDSDSLIDSNDSLSEGEENDESSALSSENDESSTEDVDQQSAAKSLASKVNNLKSKMKDRLNSARFRFLNEKMYTQSGDESLKMFVEDKGAFSVYHEGFQSQVSKWPTNPVDKMIQFIKKRPTSHVVADFGCGEAQIAQAVPNKVHSFDLVAVNKHVTKCDIAKVPLKKKSVDIGIFCLSLMGTNLVDFLVESHRVLKDGGTLLVAEVVSRFEKVGAFVRKMEKLGFTLKNKEDKNKMFIWFEFNKTGKPNMERLPQIELNPCTYKKR